MEGFLVRSWVSIRRLLWLVAWAFWWLNESNDVFTDGASPGLMSAKLIMPVTVSSTELPVRRACSVNPLPKA